VNSITDEACCKFKFIINKDARIKIWWDLLTNLFYILAYFVVPYSIAFELPNREDSDYESWHLLEVVLDIVFLCDMLVTFVTDVDADPGAKVTNKTIALNYMSSYFIFDLLSCIPGLITSEQHNGKHWIYWLKMCRYS